MKFYCDQPKNLESLVLSTFGKWIESQTYKLMSLITKLQQHDKTKAEALLSLQIKIIKSHLNCNVPTALHDKLAIKAKMKLSQLFCETKESETEESDNQTIVIGRMLEILFTKNLTSLLLDSAFYDMFSNTFFSKSHMLTGLIELHLSPYKEEEGNLETSIIQSLKVLKNLKCFTIENVCSDNILKCLVKNCTSIEELKVVDSVINDKSVDILIQLDNLTNVDLIKTKVSYIGIGTILLSCKNMEYINTTQTDMLVPALEYIVSLKKHSNELFKLKHFTNYNDMTLEQLQLVVKMCPLIENICLSYSVDPLLNALNDLQNLNELMLTDFDFYEDEITEMLELKGRNLKHLHLLEVEDIDINALKCINQMCPNLHSLKIEDCIFVSRIPEYDCTDAPLPFLNLKKLHLESESLSDCFDDEHVLFLLSHCPNIETIIITASKYLSTDIMMQVLDKNPLIYLKKFAMWGHCTDSCKLFIARITQNCINPPHILFQSRITYI